MSIQKDLMKPWGISARNVHWFKWLFQPTWWVQGWQRRTSSPTGQMQKRRGHLHTLASPSCITSLAPPLPTPHIFALNSTLLIHHGLVLKCWVLLQKIFGCSLIMKLHSIPLMKADFNGANKMVFCIRILENVLRHAWCQKWSLANGIGWSMTCLWYDSPNKAAGWNNLHRRGKLLQRDCTSFASISSIWGPTYCSGIHAHNYPEDEFIVNWVWGLHRLCHLITRDQDSGFVPG